MSERKEFGRIKSVRFGFGGYQECEFGLFLELGGTAWGVNTSISGGWSTRIKHGQYSKWTEEGRSKQYDEMCRKLQDVLTKAKVENVDGLIGKPVEVTFDGMALKDWRILEEVL